MSSDSPAAILFDEMGNPVGVVKDGYFYRLQVESVITDGYNGLVSVKPPNTPAVPADTSLVVAISPNSIPQVTIDGYVETNPNVLVANFPVTQSVTQGTTPWIVSDGAADGYLASILANQTNGSQQVVVDGYVDVAVSNFPPVQSVSGVGTFSVQEVSAPIAASTNVSASISSVILLSSNSSRLGATVWNDSTTATLYLKLGTTASDTSYTVQVFPSGYYEVPFGYTGEIDGIWSAAVGAARISELT
jgi:hypothetical protein